MEIKRKLPDVIADALRGKPFFNIADRHTYIFEGFTAENGYAFTDKADNKYRTFDARSIGDFVEE